MTDLKKCPFRQCGGEGRHPFTVGDRWVVECSRCDCAMEPQPTKEDAIAYWNDREDGAARFTVGDKVIDRLGQRFTVSSRHVYECHNERGAGFRILENELEPAPDQLPEGHIYRFWRVGAWIELQEAPEPGWYSIVISDNECANFYVDNYQSTTNRDSMDATSWGFHHLSPIQEEVDCEG